ncbi:3-hydroxybutyryl-CoA dehydrogenase [Palleronia aestuarii]|uniref:3-hydroxybutyryl-CoA dehydrogenase n=1 Tax=Palleronia aestuarii TaxID=568105 RepID=A0A2W7NV53_9RHOB|nr:3-hydroxyacyl-CoA dehydrogenase [Palleronia aestuarii]PZX15102.1 3-hydroxybutyryl-CoA dehydrogenase [Palleronia aestuarii]
MRDASIDIIGVIGAGTMGRGIAQLFAQSGREVRLFDRDADAAGQAVSFVSNMLRRRAEKGEATSDEVEAAIARIAIVPDLAAMEGADLVIEAVAERLEIKQDLFTELEGIVAGDAILATNTSSLMVTAIASSCARPERVAGYHFFNPVPLMKLVEVVRGERTDPALVERLAALTRDVGHHPVITADTPGFVVNHAGRALYTEGLQLLQDGVAGVSEIDTLMREMAGFRMGPFELFDLTGIDVSGPVIESVHAQYFFDPRYRSSPIVRRRIAAGLHGRKTGEGFYAYDGQKIRRPAEEVVADAPLPEGVFVDGDDRDLVALVEKLGARIDEGATPAPHSLIVTAPLGSDVAEICAARGYPSDRTIGVETFFGLGGERRCLAAPVGASAATRASARALFARDGARVSMVNDSVALVVQRIVAVIVNLGCEIAQQRVADPEDIDLAVRIGLGYPNGPLALGDRLGPARVLAVLEGLQGLSGDPRYRPSGWLRRRARLGLSLRTPDRV